MNVGLRCSILCFVAMSFGADILVTPTLQDVIEQKDAGMAKIKELQRK